MAKNKDKPIWSKKHIEKVKKYLQSAEFAEDMKKFNAEFDERNRREEQELREWWLKNKDIPFMLTV